MISTPSSSWQKFLVRAACYSFYTPLVVLLALLIFLTLADRPSVLRAGCLVSVGIYAASFLAGLTGLFRIFNGGIDRFSLLALIGMILGFGVGFIAYIIYDFPSC